MCPYHELAVLSQAERHVRYLKRSLNYRTDPLQQILQVHDRRALLGDRVDRLQLTRPPPLEGIKVRILKGNGSLCRKQSEQVNLLPVEMVGLIALAIENADDIVPQHQRDGQFGPRCLGRADIAGIAADVWNIDGLLAENGCARDARVPFQPDTVGSPVPSDLCTHTQLLFLFINQEDGGFLQLEIVACDAENPVQALIQIKGRQNGLGGV